MKGKIDKCILDISKKMSNLIFETVSMSEGLTDINRLLNLSLDDIRQILDNISFPAFVFLDEHDVLNVALFGMTAKEWREKNPEESKEGNIRDYADLLHLIILNNLENINAELIEMGMKQQERLVRLNNSARKQIELLQHNENIAKLETNKRS